MAARTTLDLERRPGYVLKRVDVALRSAMAAALRRHDLTVPQYACLEVALHRPGASVAALARDAFVTRQAMHQLLGDLRARELVTSAPHPDDARAQRVRLTQRGRALVRRAARDVLEVEAAMVADLTPGEVEQLLEVLRRCSAALSPSARPPSPPSVDAPRSARLPPQSR